ncbi:MAG TPA: transcriptional regulator [Gammaproteobacteria bacterium]|nr:transcriptional regulator [Gammaproteobacteria bacterium]HBF06740.1 transcriptional regulator [Gammaproteobacteria bacterium]HCK93063.1 transcriptional regulator [Gammaproteobacteria bacterium]|tara:strand:- start:102 stop:998 length:897 start_codon:yes stop_codon:yes gene_type:complete
MININTLDLNLLKVFDAIMDERHISRAAERLCVTQPAVSGMVKRLRQHLDDELFIRTRNGVIPTQRAEELALPIKNLLQQLNIIFNNQSFDPLTAQQQFTFAATDYTQQVILEPFLLKLRQIAPQIKCAVLNLSADQTRLEMSKGNIDFAFMTPEDAPAFAVSKALFKEEYVFAISKSHRLSQQSSISVKEFCEQPQGIVSYDGGSFRTQTDEVLMQLGFKRDVSMSMPSFSSLINLIKKSDITAIIPKKIAEINLDLKTFDLPFEISGFTKLLVWHERTQLSIAHEWIREQIFASCK